MHQVILHAGNGTLRVVEVPQPQVQPGHVLIANRVSVISAGTERWLMKLAQSSLLSKARQRPDLVRDVLRKVRAEGFFNTLRQVRDRLDEPMPIGNSSAGVVLACGEGVTEYRPGDRVASNGPHAQVVCVPKHLCARVADSVSDEQAAFAVLGAIALQGVRLSRLALGETALVVGLGLVGQLVVVLLRAAGVRVLGVDPEPWKCDLARSLGAALARPGLSAEEVRAVTGGLGADAVLISASTDSNGPIELAADAVRQKGRVVSIGAVRMDLPRRPFYFKEAEVVVSCSYGPGRYDPRYEEAGQDYPAAHVRWTEQRNMQAFLDLLADGRFDLAPLVTHRFPLAAAEDAYRRIEQNREPTLGVLLQYPQRAPQLEQRVIRLRAAARGGVIGAGFVGCGAFARGTLLPALRKTGQYNGIVVCSARGLSTLSAARRFRFAETTTDPQAVWEHPGVDVVFITTRHHLHAAQLVAALQHGKHAFVEKPLCLTAEELQEIEGALPAARQRGLLLMVGFNRRFSPAAQRVRALFAPIVEPKTVSIRFNAGRLPEDHWLHDERIGGGRLIGEACHAVDLATYLIGSPPVRVFAECISGPNAPRVTQDQCYLTLKHADGSVSNIAYLAGGDRAFPKERVEMFGGGRVAVIDDFRIASAVQGGRQRRLWRGTQDKGHTAELAALAEALQTGGEAPVPWPEIRATTLACLKAVESLRTGLPQDIGDATDPAAQEANSQAA